MRMTFKQRFFSWFDSYDIYDEQGKVLFTVEGQLSWGHCLKIYDSHNRAVGMVKERVLTFLPKFELYENENYVGCISKEFSLFVPRFHIDCKGWHVQGDLAQWDYSIVDCHNELVATISKKLFNWTDTYTIDVVHPQNALYALMLAIAIDAEKCSRKG